MRAGSEGDKNEGNKRATRRMRILISHDQYADVKNIYMHLNNCVIQRIEKLLVIQSRGTAMGNC